MLGFRRRSRDSDYSFLLSSWCCCLPARDSPTPRLTPAVTPDASQKKAPVVTPGQKTQRFGFCRRCGCHNNHYHPNILGITRGNAPIHTTHMLHGRCSSPRARSWSSVPLDIHQRRARTSYVDSFGAIAASGRRESDDCRFAGVHEHRLSASLADSSFRPSAVPALVVATIPIPIRSLLYRLSAPHNIYRAFDFVFFFGVFQTDRHGLRLASAAIV